MKRFLSMLALAVLVLQSVATSAVYATDLVDPSAETESIASVETEVADPVFDENSNDDVADLVEPKIVAPEAEETTPKAEESVSDGEETKADVESEEKAEEVSAETETSVVEESAVDKDETEVVEKSDLDEEELPVEILDADPTSIIYDGIRSNFGMKKVFGLKLANSAGEPEMTSEEFNKIWNNAEPCDESNPEPFCVLGPKTMSPEKEFNQLDTGDVQIRKLVQRTTNTGEYQISIQIRGKADTTKQNACAVVVFDRSASMNNQDKNGKECPLGVSCNTEKKRITESELSSYQDKYICEEYDGWRYDYECTTYTRTEYKRDNAVEGAKTFANNLLNEFPSAYIGMVTFSHNVQDRYNRELMKSTNLNSANFGSPGGLTNIHLGLMTAENMLNNKNECNENGVQKFIVLISDGAPTHYEKNGKTYLGIIDKDKNMAGDTDYVCEADGNSYKQSTCKSGQTKPSEATITYTNSITGITLLSIGYSVTEDTAQILQEIATKPEYYSNADPVTVAAAFDKILSSIKLAGKGAQLVDDLGAVQLSHGNTGHEIGDITEVGTVVSLKVTIDPDYKGDYQPTNGDVTLTYYNEEGDLQTPITISEKESAKVYWTPNPCAGDFDEPEEGVIKGGTKTKRAWVENVLTMISPAEWTYNQEAEKLNSCEWKCDSDNGYVRDGDKNVCKKQTYTVTWKNWDGEVLETDNDVPYGTTPSYDGEIPSKAADAQYTYAFAGWDKEIVTVTANAEYTATYNSEKNKYKVTFVDEDGETVLKEATEYEYGTKATDIEKPSNPEKVGYTFDKWTPELTDVTSDATYKATYTINRYTITFDTAGGSEILPITQEYGTEVRKPADPTKKDYKFAGWDKEVPATMPAENMTITASWDDDKNNNDIADKDEIFTVLFNDKDGTTLKTVPQLKLGDTVEEYTPTKKDYVFEKWTPDFQNTVKAEDADKDSKIIYTASWKEDKNNNGKPDESEKFTVIYKDGEKELNKISDLALNAELTEYTPTKEGYTFEAWTPEWVNTVKAENANENGEIIYNATWDCAQGYHYEGAEGTTAQVCVSNRTTIGELCSDVTPGEHQVYQGGDENTRIEYNEKEGWNEKYNCGLVCAPQYHEEKQSCVPDEIEVNTVDVCEKLDPANNTHFVKETQTITYVSGARQKDCSVTCNDNYHPVKQADGTSEVDDYMTYKCEIDTYTVTFDSNGGSAVTGQTVEYGKTATQPTNPTRNGYNFKEWRLSGSTTTFNFSTPITGDIILVAQWDKVSNGGGGGGGGGGSSTTYECKNLPANAEANNTNKPSRNTDYTYSEEKDGLCTFHCKSGYHPNEDKTACEKDSTGGNGGGNGDEEIVLGGQVSDKCSVEGSNRSAEEIAAYLYACENDITTIRDINKARLGDFLTRAEMAKMVSVFATKELGMKPNTSKDCSNFAESIANYNQEMKDYMVMSCQLEVMGIHTTNYQAIPDFMPSKRVSRAEFGTILSRVLWGNKYEGTNENYYINHLNALKESNIITNINPNITEYRAWVFLMLYRSVEAIKIARANNNESIEQQVNEELQEEGKAETGLLVEYDSGSIVPDMATLTESGTLATGAVDEIKSGSVVETQTGATTTLTGEDISKEVTGTVVEIGSTND